MWYSNFCLFLCFRHYEIRKICNLRVKRKLDRSMYTVEKMYGGLVTMYYLFERIREIENIRKKNIKDIEFKHS